MSNEWKIVQGLKRQAQNDSFGGRGPYKETGIDINYHDGVPFIDQADMVFICKVMSNTFISKEDFIDKGIDEAWYKDGNYHTLYIAEITDILAR